MSQRSLLIEPEVSKERGEGAGDREPGSCEEGVARAPSPILHPWSPVCTDKLGFGRAAHEELRCPSSGSPGHLHAGPQTWQAAG